MKKFAKSMKVGTAVQLFGTSSKWYAIQSINETRTNAKLVGLEGSFQRGDILSYSNTKSVNELNDLENFRVYGSSLLELQNGSYVHVYRDDRCMSKEKLIEMYRSAA